jgi:hypothetical protein
MVIFHSYVSLPEGIYIYYIISYYSKLWINKYLYLDKHLYGWHLCCTSMDGISSHCPLFGRPAIRRSGTLPSVTWWLSSAWTIITPTTARDARPFDLEDLEVAGRSHGQKKAMYIMSYLILEFYHYTINYTQLVNWYFFCYWFSKHCGVLKLHEPPKTVKVDIGYPWHSSSVGATYCGTPYIDFLLIFLSRKAWSLQLTTWGVWAVSSLGKTCSGLLH